MNSRPPPPVFRSVAAPLVLELRWARLAVLIAFGAYAVLLGYGLVMAPGSTIDRAEELGVLGTAAAALLLVRRRPRTAVLATLSVVWLDLLLSIARWGYYGGGALVALPALIVAAGMVLGVRGAVLLAAISCVALPLAYLFPLLPFATAERFNFRGHGSLLVAAEIVFVATALLVRVIILSHREALEKSDRARKRAGELFALAPDGLLELDEQSVVRNINAAALRLLGQERAAVVERPLAQVLRCAEAGAAIDLSVVRPGSPVEVTLRAGTPAARNLEIAVQQRLGAEARTMLVVRDVTARRQLEDRLAHTQRLETVGRLAGGVAHDFNNLLTAIGGNAGLLANYPDPNVREMAGDMLEAHRRGAALTRQLLAFARRDVRRPEVLDVAAAVREMARLLERVLGEQHRLALQLGPPCLAWVDRGQIEQVLLNLVSNARDAMPDGGVVAVRCAELAREEAAGLGSNLLAPRQLLLAVTDTGVGMTPEVQARLFEPFFTTKPRGRGTGLGLSIVHGIVLQNDGAIHVSSAAGRGTAVRVFLPTCEKPVETRTAGAAKAGPELAGGEHVLVVEDEIAVRRFVERALVDGGYRVTNANDAAAALAIFEAAKTRFDLVLTDIMMPGGSGLELARKLAERGCPVPVLFMSGHFDAGHDDPELDPTTNLLTKPFSADELLRRVAERLRAAR